MHGESASLKTAPYQSYNTPIITYRELVPTRIILHDDNLAPPTIFQQKRKNTTKSDEITLGFTAYYNYAYKVITPLQSTVTGDAEEEESIDANYDSGLEAAEDVISNMEITYSIYKS